MKQQKLCINTSIMPFLFLYPPCSTKSLPYIVVKLDPMSKIILLTFPNFQQIDARNHFDIKGQKFKIPYLLTLKNIIRKVLKKLQKPPPEELHLIIINLFNIITALSVITSFLNVYCCNIRFYSTRWLLDLKTLTSRFAASSRELNDIAKIFLI